MSKNIIDIAGLSKYYGKTRGIENIDLQVGEGEIFGFIGPNGAGKSTTIRILLNLIFPTKGKASIFGMDVVKDAKRIKSRIGYIPSDANFYAKMDVDEFLNYCNSFYGINDGQSRIKELCAMFELDINRRLSDLSMGNKKKVSIVQSMLQHPDVLILDEPTTGLDPLIQATFFELLREENNRGTTIFFSSHVLSEVQSICRRVAIIKEGKIIKLEDIETLRKKQLKKVSISTDDKLPDEYGLGGIENIIVKTERELIFTFSGDMNSLVKYLSVKRINNLIIEEPSLEEIFMHYYK